MKHVIPSSGVAREIDDKERAALRARFADIRAFYAQFSCALLLEPDEWAIDPYEWESCRSIRLTPIENALWHDIRAVDIVVYPQYPVGRFFVDFGNPAAKVAIECDGERWHLDKQKDARRDQEMADMGWRVYRITGRNCLTDTEELRDALGRIDVSLSPARRFVQAIADLHPICRRRRDLDLDRIKALGLNSAANSARLLAARTTRERAEVLQHFARPEL